MCAGAEPRKYRLTAPACHPPDIRRVGNAYAMTERNPDPRSHDRSAMVLVRMAPEQRDALQAAARERGTNVTALVLDRLSDVIEPEHRTA